MTKKSKAEQLLEKKYVEGYRKKPEKDQELKPLFKAGLKSFTDETWLES